MYDLLKYYLLAFRYPTRRDFISMGFGIQARHKRCQKFWAKHLEYSKDFQRRALCNTSAKSIAVLGAGRLLDLDLQFLCTKFEKVVLYDADPGVLCVWRKAKKTFKNLDFKIVDLCCCLDLWTRNLSNFAANSNNPEGLINFLDQLEAPPLFRLPEEVVLSLNLLSQIPIYWRDRVQSILLKSWGLDTNDRGNYELELQLALERSMGKLQTAHVSGLLQSGYQQLLIIYDAEFLYYKKGQCLWQSEKSIFCDDLFAGVGGDNKRTQDSWLWHIVPQGQESPEFGCIHRVEASELLASQAKKF